MAVDENTYGSAPGNRPGDYLPTLSPLQNAAGYHLDQFTTFVDKDGKVYAIQTFSYAVYKDGQNPSEFTDLEGTNLPVADPFNKTTASTTTTQKVVYTLLTQDQMRQVLTPVYRTWLQTQQGQRQTEVSQTSKPFAEQSSKVVRQDQRTRPIGAQTIGSVGFFKAALQGKPVDQAYTDLSVQASGGASFQKDDVAPDVNLVVAVPLDARGEVSLQFNAAGRPGERQPGRADIQFWALGVIIPGGQIRPVMDQHGHPVVLDDGSIQMEPRKGITPYVRFGVGLSHVAKQSFVQTIQVLEKGQYVTTQVVGFRVDTTQTFGQAGTLTTTEDHRLVFQTAATTAVDNITTQTQSGYEERGTGILHDVTSTSAVTTGTRSLGSTTTQLSDQLVGSSSATKWGDISLLGTTQQRVDLGATSSTQRVVQETQQWVTGSRWESAWNVNALVGVGFTTGNTQFVSTKPILGLGVDAIYSHPLNGAADSVSVPAGATLTIPATNHRNASAGVQLFAGYDLKHGGDGFLLQANAVFGAVAPRQDFVPVVDFGGLPPRQEVNLFLHPPVMKESLCDSFLRNRFRNEELLSSAKLGDGLFDARAGVWSECLRQYPNAASFDAKLGTLAGLYASGGAAYTADWLRYAYAGNRMAAGNPVAMVEYANLATVKGWRAGLRRAGSTPRI